MRQIHLSRHRGDASDMTVNYIRNVYKYVCNVCTHVHMCMQCISAVVYVGILYVMYTIHTVYYISYFKHV
jgi:hypothetical protein